MASECGMAFDQLNTEQMPRLTDHVWKALLPDIS